MSEQEGRTVGVRPGTTGGYPVEAAGPRPVEPVAAAPLESRLALPEGDRRDAATWIGERLRALGARVRDQGTRSPAARNMGEWLERSGAYLERRRLDGVRADTEEMVSSRPILSLAAAAAVGYIVGRTVRR